jgi:hypothetical protein
MAGYRAPYPDVQVGQTFFVHKYVLAKHTRFFRELFPLLPASTNRIPVLMAPWQFERVVRVLYDDDVPLLDSREYCALVMALHELGADKLVQRYVHDARRKVHMDDAAQLYYRLGEEKYAHALLYDRFDEWTSIQVDEERQQRCVQLLRAHELTNNTLWHHKLQLRQVWHLWALWLKEHRPCSAEVRAPLVAYLCQQLSNFKQASTLVRMARTRTFLNVLECLSADEAARVRAAFQMSIMEHAFEVDVSNKEHMERLKMTLFT